MKLNRFILSGTFALLGIFAAVCPAKMQAQTDYDIGKNAYQVTVSLDAVNDFNYTYVTIPSGYRMVIQYVDVSGAAAGNGGLIQPIVIIGTTLSTGLSAGTQILYYFAPPEDSQGGTLSTQFYGTWQTNIYADGSFEVGPAFAGYSPQFDVSQVTISGYLVSMPDPPPAPSLRARPENHSTIPSQHVPAASRN